MDELEALEALALLVKPDGIFVMSEVYSVPGCRESIAMSIVLQEGYVVARAMVENHCFGFDVYFWSSWANTRLRKMPLQ